MMGSLADPIGITIEDKTAVEDRFHQVAQRMMHHAIPKGRGTDFAAFGFLDGKMCVVSRPIGLCRKVFLECQQMIRELEFKEGSRLPATFAPGRIAVGPQEVVPLNDGGKQNVRGHGSFYPYL